MGTSLRKASELDVGEIGIEQGQLPAIDAGPIALGQWFGAGRAGWPMELEIGSGKGTFLVREAALRAEVNFIGLEYSKAFWRYAADRVRRHALANVRLVHVEAGLFLRNYVPCRCLAQVHVYFPDPWPKARHHKRRLIREGFLRLLHDRMLAGGVLRLATDHSDYFNWMQEHAGRVRELFEQIAFESPRGTEAGELVGTNFERKYRREGRPFHALALRAKK